jgi:hypothetical protein
MNIPMSSKRGRDTMSTFHRWVWLLAIFLVACQPITPMAVTESDEATTVLSEDLRPLNQGELPNDLSVAILVLDFFKRPQSDEPTNGVCFSTANGGTGAGNHGSQGAGGGANGVVTTSRPHGELVYEHLTDQFDPTIVFTEVPTPIIDGLVQVMSTTTNLGEIYLAKIDVGSDLTDAVLGKLTNVRDWLSMDLGVDYFVVNMSVVVRSCESIFEDELEEDEEEDLVVEEYLQFVECIPTLREQRRILDPEASSNEFYPEIDSIIRPHAEVVAAYYANPFVEWNLESESAETLVGCPEEVQLFDDLSIDSVLARVTRESFKFYTSLVGDPLIQAAQRIDNGLPITNTFYIAAAGNDGFPYPFAPALFRLIVSTGAMQGEEESPLYKPNRAEWILEDSFKWTLTNGITATIHSSSQPDIIVSSGEITMTGTSFATPKLSYLTTLALLKRVPMPACYLHMIYSATLLPEDWHWWQYSPTLSATPQSAIWQNLPIQGITGPCPNFPTP